MTDRARIAAALPAHICWRLMRLAMDHGEPRKDAGFLDPVWWRPIDPAVVKPEVGFAHAFHRLALGALAGGDIAKAARRLRRTSHEVTDHLLDEDGRKCMLAAALWLRDMAEAGRVEIVEGGAFDTAYHAALGAVLETEANRRHMEISGVQKSAAKAARRIGEACQRLRLFERPVTCP